MKTHSKTPEAVVPALLTGTPPRPIKDVRGAQRLLSRIISAFMAGNVQGNDARTAAYLLSTYVAIARDVDIEERLTVLEEKSTLTFRKD